MKLLLWYPKENTDSIMGGKALLNQPLGLGIIAAVTPAHWEIKIIDQNIKGWEFEEADLVGVSAMTAQIINAYMIASIYRKRGITTVLGGIHGTVCPEEGLRYFDSVVKGEAEQIWPKVINDFENHSLKRIYEGAPCKDLINHPIPRRDLFDSRYPFEMIETSRGCPFDCEFCSVASFNSKKYRRRRVEDIISEVQNSTKKVIFFSDDNMYGNTKEDIMIFKEICKAIVLLKKKIYWFTALSLNFLEDEEAVRLAAQSGCIQVTLGIESSSPEVLGGPMNKRQNIRALQNPNLTRYLHKYGILSCSMFIHGTDEENDNLFRRNYHLHKRLQIDIAFAVTMIPWPGTRLYQRLERENRLKYTSYPEDWKYYSDGTALLYKLKYMDEYAFLKKFSHYNKKYLSYMSILWKCIRAFSRRCNILAAIINIKFNLAFRSFSLSMMKNSSENKRIISVG